MQRNETSHKIVEEVSVFLFILTLVSCSGGTHFHYLDSDKEKEDISRVRKVVASISSLQGDGTYFIKYNGFINSSCCVNKNGAWFFTLGDYSYSSDGSIGKKT